MPTQFVDYFKLLAYAQMSKLFRDSSGKSMTESHVAPGHLIIIENNIPVFRTMGLLALTMQKIGNLYRLDPTTYRLNESILATQGYYEI